MTLYRRQKSGPSPRKRNAKSVKWLSQEALQIAVKRREVKSKGEKEKYIHLNADFQGIDQTCYLSDTNFPKMAVWGGLTNSCEKKRSKKQRRKGKIQASKCRVPKKSKKK